MNQIGNTKPGEPRWYQRFSPSVMFSSFCRIIHSWFDDFPCNLLMISLPDNKIQYRTWETLSTIHRVPKSLWNLHLKWLGISCEKFVLPLRLCYNYLWWYRYLGTTMKAIWSGSLDIRKALLWIVTVSLTLDTWNFIEQLAVQLQALP